MSVLGAIACTIFGLFAISFLVWLARLLSDARLGRLLREASGSYDKARFEIDQVKSMREINEAFARKERAARDRKVVRLVPRIVSKGRPLNFDDKGAA